MADIYAIPPESCQDYLTAGKKYKVEKIHHEQAFEIINDIGSNSYCLWEGCGHALGDWTRVDDALEGYNPEAVRDVVEALRDIAKQRLIAEESDEGEGGDYEFAYEAIVKVARAALARLGGAS